ncbi:SMI1/KNR4 family protein [Pseudanabaena sp. 'Roaring Creek']|uniref:SMI1/KNR4 family protein n=1 Tax=Pseudanabaena sp. 'Roaring Creek' TaxID=1681830 RepID=UPI0006D85611|nr:SMI1/KNR4 family protein [Pseudanabaena sp. 'Roaring Creek']
MEELIYSLNRISHWLENNEPNIADAFSQGITHMQIDRISSVLPFYLPEELYYLYQWHNGTSHSEFRFDALGGMYFLPLDKSITEYRDNIIELKSYGLWRDDWFPVFVGDPTSYFVIGGKEKFLSSPIYSNDSKEHFDSPFRQKYDSLTTMMQTLADCYERDAFEWTSESFYQDKEIVKEVYQRYNPISQSMRPIAEWNPPLL